MALTVVIIVHSERMSRSEPRKPLTFPQRAEGVKGGGRRTDEGGGGWVGG